jgi:hypothetical protein
LSWGNLGYFHVDVYVCALTSRLDEHEPEHYREHDGNQKAYDPASDATPTTAAVAVMMFMYFRGHDSS